MECEDIYRYLCAYLDGELDSERAVLVEEHLKICRTCRKELELQQIVKSLVREEFLSITAPDCLKERVMIELDRSEEYRESGVPVLDLIRWGTHSAQLYNTKSDLAEVLVPYIGRGLEQNELCVWVTSEMSEKEAREAITEEVPRLHKYIDKGQLQLFSYEDWYLSGGYFDSRRVLDTGCKKCEEALSNGYSGLRITGNVSWLDPSDWDPFMEYEDFVNSIVQNYKMLVLCVYKESKCSIDNIVDVMNTHKYMISKIGNLWRLRRSAEIE